MNREQIYRGLSKVAWGYVFLTFILNLGTLNVLPNWAGYLFFLAAIGLLGEELRDLPLLKPFCALLAVVDVVDWLAILVTGESLVGRFFLVYLLVVCVSIYFQFQLITDLALLAEEYGLPSEGLRGCRNVDAAISVLILLPLPWEDNELLTVLSILLLLTGIIVRLILIWQLFALRKSFRSRIVAMSFCEPRS